MPCEIPGGRHSRAIRQLLLLGVLVCPEAAWSQSLQEFAHSYAVVVGIHSYSVRQWPDLPYGRKDAEAMVSYLLSQGFEIVPKPFYDQQATKDNIVDAIVQLSKELQPEDRVLFYFSGHGTIEHNGDETWGYLVPYGATKVADYISNIDIQDFSRRMKTARHQLFVFDSCFGGQMLTRTGGVSPDVPNYITEVSKRIVREGFAAGGRNQSVLDNGPDGHSIFTSALLKGLACKADLNGDGFITFPELESYVTPLATNSYQTPATGVLPGHEGGEFVFRSPCGRVGPASSPKPLPESVVRRGGQDQLSQTAKTDASMNSGQQATSPRQATNDEIAAPEATERDRSRLESKPDVVSGGDVSDFEYQRALKDFKLKQWDQAVSLARKAAAEGNAKAMALLGRLYFLGRGVPQDGLQAKQWYEKSADAGDSCAMYMLGLYYKVGGNGFPQDFQESRRWYQKGAENGGECAGNCKKQLRGAPFN